MKRLIATAFLALLAACHGPDRDELGFRSGDADIMARLKQELSTRGIPFREDERGFILYPREHKEAVQTVMDDLYRSAGIKLEDPTLNAVALKVLADMGIPGRLEHRADGDWVVWTPHPDQPEVGIEVERRIYAAVVASARQRAAECREKNAMHPCPHQ